MLSLRHAVTQRLTPNVSLRGIQFSARRYHGDPGPQTSANRKSQRHRLRDATLGSGSGSILDGDTFRSLLTAGPIRMPEARSRKPFQPAAERGPRRPREPVSLRRDGEPRRDRPARIFDQASGKWKFVGSEGKADGAGVGSEGGPRERYTLQAIKPYLARIVGMEDAAARAPTWESRNQRPSYSTSGPSRHQPSQSSRSPSIGRSKDDPFTTSALLRDHIKAHPSPMSNQQIEAALRIVESAPKSGVNVVVWNQLLALLGREGRMEKMWKSFNDMKKTGIKPSVHTFTSLLNSYAGVAHSSSPFTLSAQSDPPPNHLSRVTIIWKQAQTHLATLSSGPSGLSVPDEPTSTSEENVLAPVNAYMKFLARYRMWEEMWGVYQDAKISGQAWDRVGYTTLFQGLLSLARRQVADSREGVEKKGKVLVGPMAREIWDDAVRALDGKRADDGGLDNVLAGLGVGTLLMGRPEDQRFALDLIPALWEVTPLPSTSSEPTLTPPSISDSDGPTPKLPNLKIDIKTATTLLHSLSSASRPTLASHYASLLLARPRIRREADAPYLYACATAFADTGDITAVLDLLQKHCGRPPPTGWKMGFWYDCLSAARWARVEGEGGGKGDWEGVKSVLGWMGVIPKENKWVSEGDEWKRKRAPLISGPAAELDAKAMVIILKTALGRNKAEVVEAVQILEKQGLGDRLQWYEREMRQMRGEAEQGGKRPDKRFEWFRELSKDLGRALEGLGERDAQELTSEGTRAVVDRVLRAYNEDQGDRQERPERRFSRDGGGEEGYERRGRSREIAGGRRGLDLAWKR